MDNDNYEDEYPGFEYTATEIRAFSFSRNTFLIWLHKRQLLHFKPDDAAAFRKWLLLHRVWDFSI